MLPNRCRTSRDDVGFGPSMLGAVLGLIGIAAAILVPLGIERFKRPVLGIDRSDDLNYTPPGMPPRRMVHIRVRNEPITGWPARLLLRNVATGCRVSVRFTSRSDGVSLHIDGRWSAAPEPLRWETAAGGTVFAAELVPSGFRLDVQPGADEVVAVALKDDGDASAFAFGQWSYRVPDLKLKPWWELPHDEYDVEVVARAGGIEARRSFVLHNAGTTAGGLKLTTSD